MVKIAFYFTINSNVLRKDIDRNHHIINKDAALFNKE